MRPVRCSRCGQLFVECIHFRTGVNDMSDAEAVRVQARYAFGKRHNPDHDTTSYRDRPDAAKGILTMED